MKKRRASVESHKENQCQWKICGRKLYTRAAEMNAPKKASICSRELHLRAITELSENAQSDGENQGYRHRCGGRPQPAGTIWRPVAPVAIVAALKATIDVPTDIIIQILSTNTIKNPSKKENTKGETWKTNQSRKKIRKQKEHQV